MAKYKNLPGVSLELLDGNIVNLNTLEQPVALVIGRAYKGKSNTELLMDSNTAAVSNFGAGSPLLDAATRVKAGGIKTVLAYRIGGKSATLTGFAGTDSTLSTVEESKSVAENMRVYLGPSVADPAIAVLIVFFGTTGNKIVYSNVPGAEVDLGLVTVQNFDNTTTNKIGSPTDPVIMSQISTAGTYSTGSKSVTLATGATSFVLTGATTTNFKKVVSATVNGAVSTAFTVAFDVIANRVVFSPTTPVDADAWVVQFEISAPFTASTFISGDDGLNATKNEYYEMVDAALRDVEATVAEYLYVVDAPIDELNAADGSTATDKLGFLNLIEEDGEFTYEWGTSKKLYRLGAGTTTNPALADVDSSGQPIISKVFNEVNYAHRIGSFCQSVAENDGFILAVVETLPPTSTSVKAVSRFVGVLPVVDDSTGFILVNGTGLLGNKFMSGSTTRDPGLFATDTGFPDGTTLTDSGNVQIDIGKFLSVVGQFITYSSKMVSGAANYLGMIGSTTVGDSTTNRIVSNVSLPYSVKKSKLDELTGSGFVTFITKTDGVHVVSGELATASASDYQYVSTALIVQDIVSSVRIAAEPYIGKGMTQVMVAAMKTAIDTVLRTATAAFKIESSNFDVVVTGIGKISIPLTIVPTYELRQVYIPISLSAQ